MSRHSASVCQNIIASSSLKVFSLNFHRYLFTRCPEWLLNASALFGHVLRSSKFVTSPFVLVTRPICSLRALNGSDRSF